MQLGPLLDQLGCLLTAVYHLAHGTLFHQLQLDNASVQSLHIVLDLLAGLADLTHFEGWLRLWERGLYSRDVALGVYILNVGRDREPGGTSSFFRVQNARFGPFDGRLIDLSLLR